MTLRKPKTIAADEGAVADPKYTVFLRLLDRYGAPILLLAYFVWKDYTMTERIVTLMTKVDSLLQTLPNLLR
jgi:hypothetical protein